ncbi:TonB-dependent receptor [Caulobacter sp. RHG1]|uniref:TonB-dependent receptor n=1 Tax=Caulobacter sp. (strain RHG1) TaxID=2545762 RepID=UPI00155453FC|nr:TonB-dependent receptor [Caulobacter sp. RHG1]NQE63620.1 TonB-dependent receptor [Caulobacter sp. RHG1]
MSYAFGAQRSAQRSRTLRQGLMLATAGLASLACAQAHAQTASAGDSDVVTEIVVSATRRGDVSVQNTPLAITAFSGATLEKQGIATLQDLSKVDPSLTIQSYGASQTKVIIRGIQSNVGATSGIYLDETPLVGAQGGNILGDGKPGLRLYDLDHIEVLKGPQGTLFGASSMSGTLRVITTKPDLNDFGGRISVGAAALKGGNNYYDGNASLNVPIIADKLALRVTGWSESGGGFVDQTVNGVLHKNNNDAHVKGGRAILLFQPTDRLTITATATHQEIDVDGTQAWHTRTGPYNNPSPTIEFYRDNYNLYNVVGEYDLGFGTVTASSSYTNQRVVNPKDSTPTAQGFGLTGSTLFVPTAVFKDWVSELRFSSKWDSPFQIVAGGYYENSQSVYQTNSVVATSTGEALCYTFSECVAKGLHKPGRGNSLYEFGTNTKRSVGQYAVYAQADYTLSDSLTATVGLRYFKADIHDIITNLQTVFPDFIFGRVTTPSVTGDSRGSNDKPSYNVALMWKATPDISVYARAASGFRIGGVNTATSLAQQAGVVFPGTYNPDSLWNYELGVKSYWLDRKLFVDAAFYRIDWNGQQLSAQAPGAFAYTINAGKTEVNGVEVNSTFKPLPGLSLSGSVNYVDAKLASDLPADVMAAGTFGFTGDRVPLTPKWAMTFSAEYEADLTADVRGYAQAGVNYRGGSTTSFNNRNTYNTKLPAFYMINAKLGVRKDAWDLSLFGENLTDKAAYLGVVESLDGIRVFSPRPRTVGVRISSTF